MKFIDIYKAAISFWPEEIDISGGKQIEETDGFYSENLSNAWNLAEDSSRNEWEALMIWVMYQELHKKAAFFHEKGKPNLLVNDLDLSDLEQKYHEALKEEGYEDMLKEYSK